MANNQLNHSLTLILSLALVQLAACGGSEASGGSETGGEVPEAVELELRLSPIKQFDFSWTPSPGADYYQLLEQADEDAEYLEVGSQITGNGHSLTVPLFARIHANYVLQACNDWGCTDSAAVAVTGTLTEAVGYLKASNSEAGDWFGGPVALSSDGRTLAVGASTEASGAVGIDGDSNDNSAGGTGAVYVFVRDEQDTWTQQAYLKASNPDVGDQFGWSLALSGDGSTLAVGPAREASNAVGINGDEADNSADGAGAVYVFVRDEQDAWSQQAYVKASNTGEGDWFGWSVALNKDGSVLAVGAAWESSNAVGIESDQSDDSASQAGAVYVFVRDEQDVWSQEAYVKASNTDAGDWFGVSVALSGDGGTLAIGAPRESSNAAGVDGEQNDDSADGAGAVYMFVRDDQSGWVQQAYLKASNPDANDQFGADVALSEDGGTLAIGAALESSNAIGIDGDQANDAADEAGAVYVFVRDQPGAWTQQAYVKASNTKAQAHFGDSVALSADASVLAVGASFEASDAVGINGDQANDSADGAGAVYVFVRDEQGAWSQQAYVKASNTDVMDQFGSVALNGDASILAVGAFGESGNATGIDGDQSDASAIDAGAVYLY